MTKLILEDKAGLRNYLLSFDLWKGAAQQEGINYLRDAFLRLMTTLSLVPVPPRGDRPRLLELGANPYFMTLLLKHFRPQYELHLANYFGPHFEGLEHQQSVTSAPFEEEHDFPFLHFNVETDAFPYPDAHFDIVLFAEIIEHLTSNPARTLTEIHRVLKPSGQVLLTTPNVLRLQNITALIRGKNIYDAFSGYGPYGRHNREYSPGELTDLAQGCGYTILQIEIEETSHHSPLTWPLRRWWPRFRDNIYLLAQPSRPRTEYRPEWLYRSLF